MEKEKIGKMNGGELAKWLHDNYERISKEVNWKTQEKCKVEFEDLPKENKSVMLRMAQLIQVELITPFIVERG